MRIPLLAAAVLATTGCVTDRMTDPAIVTVIDHKAKFTTVTTTADRRIFVLNGTTNRTCGEPPAGVAENVGASLSNSLAAAVKAGGVQPEVRNSFAESAAKTVVNVAQKTQGMMLYEAMASGLCMAYANDMSISSADYTRMINKSAEMAAVLIAQELDLTKGVVGPNEKPLTPTETGSGAAGSNTNTTTNTNVSDTATATAVASGAAATSVATNGNQTAVKATADAIAAATPANASIEQRKEIVNAATAASVSQATGDSGKGQRAADRATTVFEASVGSPSAEVDVGQVVKDIKAIMSGS
ncbi:hypothetical protein [Chitinophaga sp.]|uniref:hypothetical protein n=1 Tax=Chitinophaga sp. TaxID=1869181 RepID=UPI002F930795